MGLHRISDVASQLEKRRSRRLPGTRPYTWGFYYGCMGLAFIPISILWLFGALLAITTQQLSNAAVLVGCAIWIWVDAICCWFIIRRKKWAWVAGSALSCNPIIWIINGIYAGNRWKEFDGLSDSGVLPSGWTIQTFGANKLQSQVTR